MPKSIFFEVKGQHDLKIQGFNCCLDAAASHMATKFPTLPVHNGSILILKVVSFKVFLFHEIFSHPFLNVSLATESLRNICEVIIVYYCIIVQLKVR